jgi:uncharacterized MAPEG superfamily protein
MVGWILAALLLLFLQTLLPPGIRYLANGRSFAVNFRHALGPRDAPLPTVPAAERAGRALANLGESLPIFLTLALLVVILDADGALARTGAAIYVLGRVAYVPCYVAGVFLLRSAVWGVAGAGLLVLAGVVVASVAG